MRVKLLLIAALIIGCGESAQQRAERERRHDDSVKAAAMAEAQQRYEHIQDLKSQIEGTKNRIGALKRSLQQAKAEMEVAVDKLSRIKEFHFGRAPSEREDQIRDQTLYIQQLGDQINSLKEQLIEGEQKSEKLAQELTTWEQK